MGWAVLLWVVSAVLSAATAEASVWAVWRVSLPRALRARPEALLGPDGLCTHAGRAVCMVSVDTLSMLLKDAALVRKMCLIDKTKATTFFRAPSSGSPLVLMRST